MEPESLRLVSVENLRWMPPSCIPDASQMLQAVLPARLIKPHLLNLCSPKNQWSFPTCLIKAVSRDGHPSHRIDASEGARDLFLGEKTKVPPDMFFVLNSFSLCRCSS